MIWNEKLLLTSKKAFSIALPLLSASAYFNMVTVSKCPTGEEGIKADFIFQHHLSCLSVATKDKPSTVLKCPNWWEPRSPCSNSWIKPFEGTLPSCQASFQSRGFEKLVYVKWRSCSMSKQNLPYPFKPSLSLVKVIKPSAKLIPLKLNLTSVDKFENEILLRCAWTKETTSLNAIIKCVNFTRLATGKYQTRAFKFSMHHLHNRQRPLIAS